MKKIKFFLSILTLLVAFSYMKGQGVLQRKPDVQKIAHKAAENFKLAKSDGKLQNRREPLIAVNRNGKTYKELPASIRIPAQYEESQAIVMTWQYKFDENYNPIDTVAGCDEFLGKIACDLAEKIQLSAKVIIRISKAEDSISILKLMAERGTPLTNYAFYISKIDSFWDRDSGPISFYYGDQDSIGMIDMDYYTLAAVEDDEGNVLTDFETINQFGRINDDKIPVKLAEKLGYSVFTTNLNDEGGNIISDGLGSMWGSDGTRLNNIIPLDGSFIGDSTLTLFANYPPISSEQYDTLYKESFKVVNHIEPGVFSCDGGTGHIDIYGKLIDENTFALVDYTQAVNHTDYETWNANLEMFQKLKDSNGKPITIKLVPMPRIADGSIQSECEIAPLTNSPDQRTYINGVFVNKTYIMPVQSPVDNLLPSDVEAIEAFQQAMPGYSILPIDASNMFGTGGAIHCITMQIPAENPVYIRHNAITGLQPFQNNFTIDAFIKNKSGLSSQFVYYKKSTDAEWEKIPMTGLANHYYNANIPGQNINEGDIIHYFIEATSNNGKTMAKPIVAREGGYYTFVIESSVKTEEIAMETNFVLTPFPNPSKGSFQLPFSIDQTRNVSISIYDIMGKNVYTNQEVLDKGLHVKSIDLISVSGLYLIKVAIDGQLIKTYKVMVD